MKTRPRIIPIFLPHAGCAHRCVFCNQEASGGQEVAPSSVGTFIASSLARLHSDRRDRGKEVAFYGGSFTALSLREQARCLEQVEPFLSSGQIGSIRISTRPDALSEENLLLLRRYGVRTVEIGAQSMHDEVLSLAHRGHGADDTVSAISRLRRWDFEVGLQLMIGLPGDTLTRFLGTLDRVIALQPDFVRIHPTLVLQGAPLEGLWRRGEYTPLSLAETIKWLKRGILMLESVSIRVARVGLQPTETLEAHLLAGPYHPALRQLVDSSIAFDLAIHLLRDSRETKAILLCPPSEVSNLRGQRNENLEKLRDRFRLREISVQPEDQAKEGSLALQTSQGRLSVHRLDLLKERN